MEKNNNKLNSSQVTRQWGVETMGSGLYETAMKETDVVLRQLNTSFEGLTENMVDEMRDLYGNNEVTYGEKKILVAEDFRSLYAPIYCHSLCSRHCIFCHRCAFG